MATANPSPSGTFRLGGQLQINRLGFGAMRVTGPGIWGQPPDRAECLATLRRVPELGINFVDTADAYGPTVSEPLIREALHPYPDGLVIATKGGQVRTGPDQWVAMGRPEYLLQQVKMSLRLLRLEQLPLWQLHRIDPAVPRDEQFDAIRTMIDEGLVRFAGLSEVSVDDLDAAQAYFPVATVQNKYSASHRKHDDVLAWCERHHVGFIPWAPMQGGALVGRQSPLRQIAQARGASAAQVALAWLLRRSPVMLPIPGTSRRAHLEENAAAANLALSNEEFNAIAAAARA